MDIEHIRDLLKEGGAVVIAQEGKAPLVVRELPVQRQTAIVSEAPVEEIQISSRWPKGRSINETEQPVRPDTRPGGDQVLERLNKEILALRDQIIDSQG